MAGATVLLGAGASVDAGVPGSFELTKQLVDEIENGPARFNELAKTLNYVCGALIAQDAAAGKSPFESLDVERVFAAVELLAGRRDLEVSAFVSSWHPAVDQWDKARVPAFFNQRLQKAILDGRGLNRADKVLTSLVDQMARGGEGAVYRDLSRLMISSLERLIAITPKDVSHLAPLVDAAAEAPGGLTIATLNYDLSVEGAAEFRPLPLATGIEEWQRTRQWRWPQAGIRLLKLHGSIDWQWADEEASPWELQNQVIEVLPPEALGREHDHRRRPVLVFGARGKLDTQGPFRSLLGEWERQLKAASHLIVLGYSFRDDHVNQAVTDWLNLREGSELTLVSPNEELPEYVQKLQRKFNWTGDGEPAARPRVNHTKATAKQYLLRNALPLSPAEAA